MYGLDTTTQDTRRYDAWLSASAAQEEAEAAMFHDFVHACRTQQAHAPANFAPRIVDYSKPPIRGFSGKSQYPLRQPTLAECMQDATDYEEPHLADVFQLLLDAASGKPTQARAQALIEQMAATFARHNAEAQT
ncbi:MAG: hypothetical protein Q4F13_02610 [Pseudomonadota bacterium]|nr:hypothetical protein [Pseudomonadota bacterium]